MKPSRGAGEYQTQTPIYPIYDTDIPIALVSRLWAKLMPGGIYRRVDGFSKQFTGAGWKHLPQELVDAILGYLVGDLDALKACSLTCKLLFGATRPLIHRRLCLASRPDWMSPSKPKGFLFNRPEAFERLINPDRSGLLRYTRRLTFKIKDGSFTPRNVQVYLPHLRSITNLHSLTIDTFYIHSFIPVFNECFGMFTHTLRQLDIWNAHGTERQILYIICQFPLLEDLGIGPLLDGDEYPGYPLPITQSPPLRGKLTLGPASSKELFEGLAGLPGGLNFRSLELTQCNDSQPVLAACSHAVTLVSYLWYTGYDSSKPNYFVHERLAM